MPLANDSKRKELTREERRERRLLRREKQRKDNWPAPGSEDTELGVLMEAEVGHGETEIYARIQA